MFWRGIMIARWLLSLGDIVYSDLHEFRWFIKVENRNLAYLFLYWFQKST